MAEFSAVANLRVVPTDIDSAKREIERELGDLEVGVSANRPMGGGGGAIGSRSSEPGGIDLSRRQLGQQERLVELAQERNDFLEELTEEGFGGGGGGGFGGGGGGFGGAFTGGAIGAAASRVAGALTTTSILGATFGAPLATAADRSNRMSLDDPLSLVFGEMSGLARGDPSKLNERLNEDAGGGAFENILNFFSGLNVPEGGTGDGGADISRPAPNIENRFNIDANVDVDSTTINEQQIDQIVDRKTREMAEEIRRNLERSLGGGTGPRTTGNPAGPVGGPGSSGPTPF